MPYRNEVETTGSRPGRPRDRQREQDILTVAAELLTEVGYDDLSFEEVARRAGASKATLYRRWKTKRELAVAALKAGPAQRTGADEIDTGTLRGDLLALLRRLDDSMRSAGGRSSLLLLQAGLEDPDLCEEIERAVGPTGARLPPRVIASAIARDELPGGVDPFPYEEVAGSVLLLRRLNGLRVDDRYLEHLVDTVLLPSLTAGPSTTSPAAGIFSGHPEPQPRKENR